jgi:hypothetical protein
MSALWPWLVVAGLGALHGLNPASGWLPATLWSLRSRDRHQALWALVPIAAGHIASVGLVALAVAFGLGGRRIAVPPEGLAALLLVCAVLHVKGRPHQRAPAAHAGLALGSFWMATAQGAGSMLIPALAPLCMKGAVSTADAAGIAFVAVGLHTGAMLIVTGAMACAASSLVARTKSGGSGTPIPDFVRAAPARSRTG